VDAIEIDKGGDNADWIKMGWGLPEITSAAAMRQYLQNTGSTVEEFKLTAAYRLPLKHGRAPKWLADL